MLKYFLRRLLISIPVLLGITMITFAAYNLAPGDPVSAMIDPSVPVAPEVLEKMKEDLGLNKPITVRYVIWLKEALRGNLGYAYNSSTPVLEKIGDRLPATLALTLSAMLLAVGLGVPLGVYSALRQYSTLDYVLTFLAFVAVSIPAFFFALGIIYVFSVRLGLFPVQGLRDPDAPNQLLDFLRHLVLPATALGLERIAGFQRYTRSAVLEVLGQDYMTTARAKGLQERTVLWRHGFRNALISMITILSLSIPGLFGGAFVIEWIFSWPGMGQLAVSSVTMRDYPTLMGIALVSSTLVLLSNLLADMLYAVADPRIRYS